MAVVDWRNRFNANWVTSVRSQGSAPNCWAFGMAALYESMVRIEHGLWSRRSEGDLGRATGKQPWDLGTPGEAAIAAERFGAADPDCLPWSEAAVLYTAKPHGAAMTSMPMSPTPDRPGRTLRIDANTHTSLGPNRVADKKKWINLVGPMVFCALPSDFTGTTGVFATVGVATRNFHVMLVVGFDDLRQCWILKNSWGAAWGDRGYVSVAYGQPWLDDTDWTGVRNTNPDPWTKRRRRNGVLAETGNGALHRNRELFVRRGADLHTRWQEAGSGTWQIGPPVRSVDDWRPLPGDALDHPAMVQSTFNRNYELVYRSSISQLRHVFFDQASGWWFDGGLFGPIDPLGIPGFVQGGRGAPGDFEVVVLSRLRGSLEHWTKHNGSPWTNPPGTWTMRARIALNGITASGPALVSSRRDIVGELEQEQGELHCVAAAATELRHYGRPARTGVWTLLAVFGSGTYSSPAMIESLDPLGDEEAVGPLQLFVEAGNRIEHWILFVANPFNPTPAWKQVTTFGGKVLRVIGALQGSDSNLTVCTERTDGLFQIFERVGVSWVAGAAFP